MFRPLSNVEIARYYSKNPRFGGVLSKDELKNQEYLLKYNDKKFWILNMENRNAGSGSHWVGLSFLDPQHGVYFDSYSTHPPRDILNFMKKYRITNYQNEGQIQSLDSISCGYFVIYIMDNLLKGRKYLDILDDFSYTDLDSNERVLQDYFKNNKKLRL